MAVKLRSAGIPTRTEEQIYKDTVKLLDLSLIYVKENIRKDYSEIDDLVESIQSEGLLHPITVIRDDKNMYYVLIGHRRFIAYKKLNEENHSKFMQIPAIVRYPVDDIKRLEIQIIENEQRNNFKPLELANAIKELKQKSNMSNKEIGERIGKGEKWIRDHLTAISIVENIIQETNVNSDSIVVDDDFVKDTNKHGNADNKISEGLLDIPIHNIVETKGLPPILQNEILQNKNLNQKEIRQIVSEIKNSPEKKIDETIRKVKEKKQIVVDDDFKNNHIAISIENFRETLPKRQITNISRIYNSIDKIKMDNDIKRVFRHLIDKLNQK